MLTSSDCLKKYGNPLLPSGEVNAEMQRLHMELWIPSTNIREAIPAIPGRIFLNKDLKSPLENALNDLVFFDLACHLMTWDGCFEIRKKRGLKSLSLHSWAVAIDINAFWNQLRQEPQMNRDLVEVFEKNGFDWGGHWKRKDGMHFQLKRELVL